MMNISKFEKQGYGEITDVETIDALLSYDDVYGSLTVTFEAVSKTQVVRFNFCKFQETNEIIEKGGFLRRKKVTYEKTSDEYFIQHDLKLFFNYTKYKNNK